MKKNISIISIITLLSILLIVTLYSFTNKSTDQACINSQCFQIEIAKTSQEREKGLMNRESLNQNAGMLFIFQEEGVYPFWMKNTLIPLDIIWINKDKKIIHIEKNVQPCKAGPCPSYSPEKQALYVLEINTGLSERYSFKEGNEVTPH